MIKIKKHDNNKFYVSSASRYTNLTEIKKLVQSGEKIEVLNSKEEDITAETLAKVIGKMNVPVGKLERLIRGDLQ